ncbi:SpoIID/LytB domain-containing protein [Patescibacteria group bacterium]
MPVAPLTNLAAAIDGDRVYLIENGEKIWITSPWEFINSGYKWSDIRFLSADLINSIPSPSWEDSRLYKKESDSVKVYFRDSVGVHHIPDGTVFSAWNFSEDDIINISDQEFNYLNLTFDLSFLVMKEGGSKVYFLNQGVKHWIVNPDVFNAWGFDWSRISTVPEDYLNSFESGKDLKNLTHISPKVYLVDSNELRWIENEKVFNDWGFDWDDYLDISSQVVSSLGINTGESVSRLVHEYGKVHVLIGGAKHWFPDSATFFGWGFSSQNITFDLDHLIKQKISGSNIPNPTKAVFRSSGSTRLKNSSNQTLHSVSDNNKIYLGFNNNKYLAAGKPDCFKFSSDYFRIDSTSGVVEVVSYNDIPSWDPSLNDNKFRGFMELRYSSVSNKSWIVNELPLEKYLNGIAEASSSAPFEHLKTMSTAARSYAFYHYSNGGKHPGEPFHLKNSRFGNGDDQVYKGYGLEARWPDLVSAVSGTTGKAVTYQGNPVITPYFSRSDGRTRSWEEVWGSVVPWCVSVPDPDSIGMTKLGHGVGLAAYGASKRAERGNSYQSILGYYYSGTAIGSVDNPNIRIAIYAI